MNNLFISSFEIPGPESEMDILMEFLLFTGRTIRAAMDALMDFGRPARMELAILVDRGHRELPIQADYKGISLDTAHNDMINVLVREHDKKDMVYIEQD